MSIRQSSKFRIAYFWLVIAFFVTSSLLSGGFAQNKKGITAIRNVRIFDGEQVIPRGTVIVEGKRIKEVGPDVPIPDDAEVIDGEGQTLLPGLMDSHVHILYPQALKQMLIFGVTTVVDMYMVISTMKNIKKVQASGKANGMASLISAGTLATVPGGHGTQFLKIPTISKPQEAQDFVDARIEEGSDFIKIIYDDGSALSSEQPTLDKATLAALIQAAHKRGKLAVVHVLTLREAREAIEAGADGLAHLYCNKDFYQDFGLLVAQHKAFVIPTLTVLQNICGVSEGHTLIEDSRISPYLMPTDIAYLKRPFPLKGTHTSYEASEKAVGQLKAEGVPILAGTDALNPGTAYGASLHHELELLVRAGLSPVEALKAATSSPAGIFKFSNCGHIKPGFNADLLLVRGDPTEDIRATRDIAAIWKNGVRVDREAYLASVKKQRQAMERLKIAPPPDGFGSGLISDFEEEVASRFGSGWMLNTDAMRGGKSQADFRWVKGGAQKSRGSMLITGTIAEKSPYSWAGVLFSPGPKPMSPANLSSKKALIFWAKGDGKRYSVMIFTRSLGFSPSIQYFRAEPGWGKHTFLLESFGTEGYDIWGIFIGASGEKGPFSLQIDDVRLE